MMRKINGVKLSYHFRIVLVSEAISLLWKTVGLKWIQAKLAEGRYAGAYYRP